MYDGVFTNTESAGMGASGAFPFVLAQGALRWKFMYEILVESARTTAVLFNTWISATIFAYFVNFTTLPGDLKQWITAWGLSTIMVVSAMMVIFVILDTLVVLAFPALSLWLPSLKDQGS